jgi:glycosyltransferase involved in cell wall biosynthesis
MNADRNPKILWEVLSELIDENNEFAGDLEIKLIGKVAEEVKQNILACQLEGMTRYIDYIPHDDVMKYQRLTQLLLLAVNNVPSSKGIVTGKIFEYLQANRPVLAISPIDGDLAEIIKKTNSGEVVGFDDKDKLKEVIEDYYKSYKKEKLQIDSENIEQYHRKNLTKELADVIRSTNN